MIKEIFPETVTNEFINALPRKELSEKQKKHSYAKYYFKDMAEIPQADLDIVNAGAIPTHNALPIQKAKDLLKDGYLDAETGYCVLEDGSGFVATKVFMKDVTPAMIDWWFNWHPLKHLRYMIWCPVAHAGIRAQNPYAHLDQTYIPLEKRNIGRVHYPTEGFRIDSAMDLEIAFHNPSVLGISQEMIDQSSLATFQIATCTNLVPRIPVNLFFHAIRKVDGGIEFRSRYWLKYTVKNGAFVQNKTPLPKSLILSLSRNNCIHSLTEYNNLASFLPELYHEQKGLIL